MMVLEAVGLALLFLGLFCANVGALGLVRFPDVFIRSHAATVMSMGGAVVSIFAVALMGGAHNPSFFVKACLTALIVIFTSPTGSHAILRAAHKSRVKMWEGTFCDMLREDEEKDG
ncbi:cation:proton antiporter [Candidatus Bathyarchaeota archaeon]|nr:MAG: cation:proton antiporter [Candidatus Hecatellales archaeon]RLI34619.1 MAG: cation:proton antiporter [Candidatus Bathyarchaeota archaeon]